MATFTDEEKVSHYLIIKEHIHLINTQRVTEDLMEEYKRNLNFIRENFWDFSVLQPEIQDYEFRSAAVQAETLISTIFSDIKMYKTFKVGDYLQLLYSLLKMLDFITIEDDISELFGTMKFQ